MAIKYLIIILLLTIFAFNLPAQGHYDLNYIENLALRNIGIIAFTIGMTANITGLAVAIPNSFGRDPVAVTAGVLMIFLGGGAWISGAILWGEGNANLANSNFVFNNKKEGWALTYSGTGIIFSY